LLGTFSEYFASNNIQLHGIKVTKRYYRARKILAIFYFIIFSIYPFAHRDFVPLSGDEYYIQHKGLVSGLGNDETFLCPAHSFAQSTTGVAAAEPEFPSLQTLCFLSSPKNILHFQEPLLSNSTRAPPLA
jgi:hypothetical protein